MMEEADRTPGCGLVLCRTFRLRSKGDFTLWPADIEYAHTCAGLILRDAARGLDYTGEEHPGNSQARCRLIARTHAVARVHAPLYVYNVRRRAGGKAGERRPARELALLDARAERGELTPAQAARRAALLRRLRLSPIPEALHAR